MSNTFKRVLSLLLVIVMLLSMSSVTVFAASSADFGSSTGTKTETGNTTSGNESTEAGDSISADWIEVSYDDDDITVTINPTKEKLLSMSVSDIKAILSFLVEAVKKVVIEDLIDVSPSTGTTPPSSGTADVDEMWYDALNLFLDSEYKGYANRDEQYLAFLKDIVGSDKKVGEFADYACDMLRVAVQTGVISYEKLPKPETVESDIKDILNAFVDSYVEDLVRDTLNDYLEYIFADPEDRDEDEVNEFINGYMDDYIKIEIDDYITDFKNGKVPAVGTQDYYLKTAIDEFVERYLLNNQLPAYVSARQNGGTDYSAVDSSIKEFFDSHINKELLAVIEEYIDKRVNREEFTTDTDKLIKKVADEYIINYIKTSIDAYCDYKYRSASAGENEELFGVIDAYVPHYIQKQMNNFWIYLKNPAENEKPAKYDYIKGEIVDGIYNEAISKLSAAEQAALTDAKRAEIRAEAEDKFAQLSVNELKSYIDEAAIRLEYAANISEADVRAFVSDPASVEELIIAALGDAAFDKYLEDKLTVDYVLGEVTADDIKSIIGHNVYVAAMAKLSKDEIATVMGKAKANLTHAELVEAVADIAGNLKANNTDAYNALIEDVVEKVIVEAHNGKFDDVLMEIFGLTLKQVYDKVPVIAKAIYDKYAILHKELGENKGGVVNPMDLLKLLDEVYVNDLTLYGDTANGKSFVLNNILALIRRFPTFEDIANMGDDEMQLSYAICIKTSLNTQSRFNITLKLGAHQDIVRRVAAIISRNISIEYLGDRQIKVDVNVPDELARAILKAAKSTRIPDSIKHEVFGKIDYTPDEAFTIIKNTSFDKILKLLDYVDFDKILDHRFVEWMLEKVDSKINNSKVDAVIDRIENLTDEQIKNKIAEYEYLYNKAIKALTKIYSYVPSELTDKNIFSLYDGNGVFSASVDKTANVLDLIDKIADKVLNNKYVDSAIDKVHDKIDREIFTKENVDRIKNLIDGFLDIKDFRLAIDAKVTFNDIYKVSYYVGSEEAYSEGFLPVGADIAYFADVKEYNGRPIIGWEARDPDGNLVTLEKMPAYDVKVAAVLGSEEIPTYKIMFVVDGELYGSVETTGNESITLPAAPTKDGYTFKGWFLADGTEFTADTLLTNPITSDLVVTAEFDPIPAPEEYNVVFKVDGETYYTVLVKENATIALPTAPTKTGYKFMGWYLADGTEFTSTTPITGNVEINAVFVANEYKVTFVANGATVETITVKYGATVATIPDAPARDGYTFDGWFLEDDTAFTTSTVITDDTVVIAKYTNIASPDEKEYTVVFVVDGVVTKVVNVKENSTVTLPTAPTKDGYTFDGWFYDDGSAFDATTPITATTVVYAKFTSKTANVTFIVDGAVYNTVTVDKNTAITLPVAPTKTGYTFAGWFFADDTELTAGAVITTDITVYAKFIIIPVTPEYKISFVVGTKVYHVMLTEGNVVIVLPTAPTMEGKVFKGWFFADGTELTTNTPLTTPITSNVIVFARFADPDYVFDVEMGSGPSSDNNSKVTEDIETPYGSPVTLWANLDGINPLYDHRFQWQIQAEDGSWTDIDGATNKYYVIENANQSGKYRCVVTAYKDTTSTEAISEPTITLEFVIIVIKKAVAADTTINPWKDPSFVYNTDGSTHSVEIPEIADEYKDIVELVGYTGTTEANKVDTYTITATYKIISDNHTFADGSTECTMTFTWYINAAQINVDKVEADITPSEPKVNTYDENTTVEFDESKFIQIPANLVNVIDFEVIGGTLVATGVGVYKIIIRVYIIDENYEWETLSTVDNTRKTAQKSNKYKDIEVTWCEIKPKEIDLSKLTWTSNDGGKFDFVFANKEYEVTVDTSSLPTEIANALVYSNNTVKYASAVAGVATVKIDDAKLAALKENYNFATDANGDIAYPVGCEWTISKAPITPDTIVWSSTDKFIYNTNAQFVTTAFAQNMLTIDLVYYVFDGINWVELGHNDIGAAKAVNAGTYKVVATISVDGAYDDNYVIENGATVTAEKTFVIDKAELDDRFSWIGEDSSEFDPDSDYFATFDTSKYTAKELAELFIIEGETKMQWAGIGTKTASVTVKVQDPANYYINVDGNRADSNTYYFSVDITPYVVDIGNFTGWIGGGSFEYSTEGFEVNFNIAGMEELRHINITTEVSSTLAQKLGDYSYLAKYVGDYTFTATITLRDDVNCVFANGSTEIDGGSVTLHISRKEISLKDVVWGDFTNPTFNGNVQNTPTVNAAGLPVGVIIKGYETQDRFGNVVTDPTNVGGYVTEIIIDFASGFDSDSYKIVNDGFDSYKSWEILPADIMQAIISSGITFGGINGGVAVVEDGTPKTIEIEGTLPEGIEVLEYVVTDLDGNRTQAVGVGMYLVTANFVCTNGNYSGTASMTAKLTVLSHKGTDYITDDFKVKVQVSTVIPFGHSIDYDVVTDIYADYDFSEEITKYLNDGKKYNADLIIARDIYFLFNGAPTSVENNKFKVEMAMPDNYIGKEGETLFVVYVSDDGSEVEVIEATLIGGNFIAFDADHFSVYGVISVTEDDTPDTPVTPPVIDDGDADTANPSGFVIVSWWWLWIIIVLLVAIIVALVIILLKKKDDDDEDDDDEEPEVIPPVEPEEAPVEEAPVEEAPAEEAPVEEAPAEEALVEEAPVEEAPAEEAPVEEAPVEEAPVEEAPVEEAPVEEAPVEEAPAEEAPVEEAPVAEPPTPGFYESLVAASENADAVRLVNGVVVPVRYRTSFMSRLIQSEPPIQDYYTIVKNYTLAYKGVKARTSWNFESFNKGRIQCVKLNVKGNAFQVYIGLDPAEYNEDKYHFVFVGDKPKLDKVPMMMKVKSDRALKYTLELIDEVMIKNGIERGETPEVDYHMPYESTEALVDKDLVKVILPEGMEIDENTIIERVNVGDLLKDVKPEEALVEEAPVEEAPVEEAPVEEAPAEEAPVEETPVEEAPVEETPVEETPVEEIPVVNIVDHRVAEEDIVHVDAVKADVIVSDAQAEEFIEAITHSENFKAKSNKCFEINLDTICENFEDGDVVTIDALKKLGLISKKADRIKVLARGIMTKKVTVVADKFSIQAVKMIGLAGGTAQKYKD